MTKEIIHKAVLPAPPFAVPTWLRPVPVAQGDQGNQGDLSLAGGLACFASVDVVQQAGAGFLACRMPVDAVIDAADNRNEAARLIDRLTASRPAFAGLDMTTPQIMGILNVTPDSFSDGGRHNAPAQAVAAGKVIVDAGAGIIDIGGESTRPGAVPITHNQELARVLPPLAGLKNSGAVISVDTRHADVMRRVAGVGAGIINDVSGLREEGALAAAAASGCAVVIMHMQGTPQTMQDDPDYRFAPVDIYDFLAGRIEDAVQAGIPRERICIDPGFGFGKTLRHNLHLVRWLGMLHGLGVPVLFGASRKSSIAKMSAGEPADQRVPGSLALALAAVRQGAQIVRVHDVAETAQAVAVETALLAAD